MAYLAGAYPGYCCMKQLGVLQNEAFTSIISPPPFLDGMLVQPIPFPNEQKKTGFTESLPVNLNSWVERSPTRVNCLASEHSLI